MKHKKEGMLAYYFCFPHTGSTGWVGMAIAEDQESLFSQIDEFGDPYSCLIKKIDSSCGFCCFFPNTEDGWEEHEVSGYMPLPENVDKNWKPFFDIFEKPK